ncbi:hypothetical protein BKA70DRAFT_100118 [Coprinopsis sp. MPI-PUGE-AT-0042]|nr:hypothetical protein BKA70DRAFT_100118 [Coprinopsis sp. MPI-PUGE-AT-0042]
MLNPRRALCSANCCKLPRSYLASASQGKTVAIWTKDAPNAPWVLTTLDPSAAVTSPTPSAPGKFPDAVWCVLRSLAGNLLAVSRGDGKDTRSGMLLKDGIFEIHDLAQNKIAKMPMVSDSMTGREACSPKGRLIGAFPRVGLNANLLIHSQHLPMHEGENTPLTGLCVLILSRTVLWIRLSQTKLFIQIPSFANECEVTAISTTSRG